VSAPTGLLNLYLVAHNQQNLVCMRAWRRCRSPCCNDVVRSTTNSLVITTVSIVTDVEMVIKETVSAYQDHRGKYNDKESIRIR
jgi:hypothetical protein